MSDVSLSNFPHPTDLPTKGSSFVVGLSGGVDSAVTAALLQAWGYKVHGITLRLFDSPGADTACRDAARVAQALSLPFEVIDGRALFETHVMRPFVEAYGTNQTPSPCCLCNPLVKFRLLLDHANKIRAEALATGHYVCRERQQGVVVLKSAKEQARDQSYFLYGLTKEQLERAFFPLDAVAKSTVRQFAKTLGLPVAQRPDSQDICFLEGTSCYAEFVRRQAGLEETSSPPPPERPKEKAAASPQSSRFPGLEPGPIVDNRGYVLGQHAGAYLYTIGQRRGLGIATTNPLYVLRLEENRVVVGPHDALAVRSVTLTSWHEHPWATVLQAKAASKHIEEDSALENASGQDNSWLAQFRSTMAPVPASLSHKEEGSARVTFTSPQYGVAPGQILVLRTQDGTILGGGIISETH